MTPLEPFEVVGFKGDFAVKPALLKTCNADEILLLFTRLAAFLAVAFVNIVLGLRVGRDNAFEVSENGLSRGLADDVIRHYGSLAAAAGSIHNEGGDAVAAGVAAQTLDYLNTLADGGTEMGETHGKVAHIDVIGTHTDLNEPLYQLFHDMYAVIDACKEYALVAEGDTCVCEHLAGTLAFLGDLIGMVEMGIQPNGMIFLEHCAELGSDPLRHDDGGTGTDADYLNMGDLAELADDVFKDVVILHESVAAGKQDIAYFGVIADIFDAAVYLLHGHRTVMLACKSPARAVAAIHGALVGYEEQNPVGITVSKTRDGGIGILMQRIELILGSLIELCRGGDALTADGIIGIVRIDEGEVIGGDRHAERAKAACYAFLLLGSELDVFFEILKGLNAIFDLPMPIVPKLIGNICEKAILSAFIHGLFLSIGVAGVF